MRKKLKNTVRRIIPVAVLIFIMLVYLRTLAPTVSLGDSGSFIAAAHCLGVAHPPGYPLWCLLAHGFTRLPWGVIAWRVNLFSAVCATTAVWLLYLTAYRLTRSRPAACTAMATLAFSSVFWSQAVVAEVYMLNALLFNAAFYFAARWHGDGSRRWLYALTLTCGLGLANHTTFALIAPLPCIWAMLKRRRMLLRTSTTLLCLVLFATALSIYAYLPLRARTRPPINWGNPVTWHAAVEHITRRAYYTEPERVRYTGSTTDILRYMTGAIRQTAKAPVWPATVLALYGFTVMFKHRRDLAGITFGVLFVNIALLSLILRGTATPDEIFTRRVFFIPAQIMPALWLALGVKRLMALIRRKNIPAKYVSRGAYLCLILPFLALTLNYSDNDHSSDTLARDFALDIMGTVPDGAGLFFIQDEFLFPCLYLQVVEGIGTEQHIISSPYFGYRGDELTAVICDVPPNDKLLEYYHFLDDSAAIPWGLTYRLIRNSADIPGGMLFKDTFSDPKITDTFDPTARRVYAAYACHHARLGAELYVTGDIVKAEHYWMRAEQLKSDDPYAHYILALMYRRCEVKLRRQETLLRQALHLYRRQYSPIAFRFYPLTEQDILTALAGQADQTP